MRAWFRFSVAAFILAAAACVRTEAPPLPTETEDQGYQEAKRLRDAGQLQKSLAKYQETLARRGSDNSPETHLELATLYKDSLRDPIRAIYHFQEYLRLKPNSPQRSLVEGQIAAATRDFASTLPGQVMSNLEEMQLQSENERLRRENESLRNQLESAVVTNSRLAVTPTPPRPEPASGIPQVRLETPGSLTMPDSTGSGAVASVDVAAQTAPRPMPVPDARDARPTAAAAPAVKNAPAGRTYTVVDGDTLWGIAAKVFGAATNANVGSLVSANPEIFTNGLNTPIRPGMQVRIP